MNSAIRIITILLMLISSLSHSQVKSGFAIQKLTLNGIEMDAIGTVIFNNELSELEIKQCILPKNGISEKNPKYTTIKLKLVGTYRQEVGDAENIGVQISGTAYDENDAHFDFNCILNMEECNLNLFMAGMEYKGKLIGD